MESREIIRRVLAREDAPRVGYRFRKPGYPNDILVLPSFGSVSAGETEWGREPALARRVPGFAGQLKTDVYGNVWGRLDDLTKGECVLGLFEQDWEAADLWKPPALDLATRPTVDAALAGRNGRWAMGMLPGMPFSILRCLRGMENTLMDVLLEEDRVRAVVAQLTAHLLEHVDANADAGADAVYSGEDWGTQEALLVSPTTWRSLFGPAFRAVADRAHERGMAYVVHSCGYILEIIPDLLDAGVDVFQFDQPELVGVERLAREFGSRVTFWSPVDIQAVMPGGDRDLIEAEARLMLREFGRGGGGFIAADYTDWPSIQIPDQSAEWARQVFLNEGKYTHG
ncbi:MAG: uroporphyrinogen decarboxylase family protein [Spirochaetales bacterium]